MARTSMKPEFKRYVNLQTLVTRGEHKRLKVMVRQSGKSVSNVLRDGLREQLEKWEVQNGSSVPSSS